MTRRKPRTPGTDNAGAHEFRNRMRRRQAIVPDGDAYVAAPSSCGSGGLARRRTRTQQLAAFRLSPPSGRPRHLAAEARRPRDLAALPRT